MRGGLRQRKGNFYACVVNAINLTRKERFPRGREGFQLQEAEAEAAGGGELISRERGYYDGNHAAGVNKIFKIIFNFKY